MQIRVRFFAMVRDRAGLAEAMLNLADGSTVATAAADLAVIHPAIADLMPRVAFAVNREYAAATTELHEGDELALIPPVSGG